MHLSDVLQQTKIAILRPKLPSCKPNVSCLFIVLSCYLWAVVFMDPLAA